MSVENPEDARFYDSARSLLERGIEAEPFELQSNLLAIFDQRVDYGFDTDFDHILQDRIGRANGFSVAEQSRETPAGKLRCDTALVNGYSTRGSLVFVGVGYGQDLEDELPPEAHFFVTTGNLHQRGSLIDWHVREMKKLPDRGLELVLSDTPYEVIEGRINKGDPVKDLQTELQSQDEDNNLPRIVMINHRIWFYQNGRSEGERISEPMTDLVEAVKRLCGIDGAESLTVQKMRAYRHELGRATLALAGNTTVAA